MTTTSLVKLEKHMDDESRHTFRTIIEDYERILNELSKERDRVDVLLGELKKCKLLLTKLEASDQVSEKNRIINTQSREIYNLQNKVKDLGRDIDAAVDQKIGELIKLVQCNACFNKRSNVVFIPCTHMVLCKGCTSNVKVCPRCNVPIEAMMHVSN